MKSTPCATGCGKTLSRVDGHAVGWRPICEPCRVLGLTWWFDEASYPSHQPVAVRGRNANFGQNPAGTEPLKFHKH